MSHLTKDQKAHVTEALVDEIPYEYEIVNDGTLEDLEKKAIKLCKQLDKIEKHDRKVEKRKVALEVKE